MTGVDVCRGLTIIGVVLHHVTGEGLTHLSRGSLIFSTVLTMNRVTQFVVPTFLFLSALVFALSSTQKRFSWRQYLRSRTVQLLWPYVVWTALYLGFQAFTGHSPASGHHGVQFWLVKLWDPGLLRGKGYYHLYYLLLALQVAMLLPCLQFLRPRSWRLPWVLAGATALQLGIYVLNLRFLHLTSVGSSPLWYVLPLALGIALGSAPGRFEIIWDRWQVVITLACLVALAAYLPLGFAEVLGTPLLPLSYSVGNWAYTTLAGLVVTGLSVELARRGSRFSAPLQRLGQLSLQVYLLHPALLWGLARLTFPARALPHLLITALYTTLGIALPLCLARALNRRRLSVYLFGR